MTAAAPLPPGFATTRDSLHAVACFVMAPAARASGHLAMRPVERGFATMPLASGHRLRVHGDRVHHDVDGLGTDGRGGAGGGVPVTTLREVAEALGLVAARDARVGRDLPPFEPDRALEVDAGCSLALGDWYGFGDRVIRTVLASQAVIWPEHFDLATTIEVAPATPVNVGFSPGDGYCDLPYVYVGPHDLRGLSDSFWNAPFGALLPYSALETSSGAEQVVRSFVAEAIDRIRSAT